MSRSLLALVSAAALLASCVSVDTTGNGSSAMSDHATHSDSGSMGTAMDRLNNSPRHQEWVEVKNGAKTIHTWVVYPERDGPTPVVILIHENRGLNDWARGMADQVAEAGYIAVAPDLLSEFSATEKKTSDFPDEDAARAALGTLKPESVQADLQAVADWAKTIPAGNGKLVSAGFCWGGAQSFTMATKSDDLAMAMVFYGTGPTDPNAYKSVSAPVVGFYGGADERVNATIDESEAAMKAAGKQFDYAIYDGAGHAFMRLGEDPAAEPANKAARDAAWTRFKDAMSAL